MKEGRSVDFSFVAVVVFSVEKRKRLSQQEPVAKSSDTTDGKRIVMVMLVTLD